MFLDRNFPVRKPVGATGYVETLHGSMANHRAVDANFRQR
jgi:hypothetical protein